MAPKAMTAILRRALLADPRPLLRIAQAAGLPHPIVYRFAGGQRKGLSLASVQKLAAALGLELRPVRKRKDR